MENRSSDIDGLAQLFQEHYGTVLGAARHYAPKPDMVFDVVQSTFIDFMENHLKGKTYEEKELAPLLYEIARRRAIEQWRRERRHCSVADREIAEKLMARSARRNETEKQVDDHVRHLRECIEELPEKSREVLKQHYQEKLSMEEIARRRKIKAGAIRQAISRIRIRLRECIERKKRSD